MCSIQKLRATASKKILKVGADETRLFCFVLFFQFRPPDFLIQICFLPFHKLRKHMHVDREKFDENRQVSGEPSRGLKLKQRTQAKMLHCGTRPQVSGYFESAIFSFRIRNCKLVRLNFDFSYI